MNRYIPPIQQHYHTQTTVKKTEDRSNAFSEMLTQAQEVKVSKHAKQRLVERDINISSEKWNQISEKMNEAKRKGVTDALVITGNTTLVVSTKNNTVVTALDQTEASSKIFTNINGTIIMGE